MATGKVRDANSSQARSKIVEFSRGYRLLSRDTVHHEALLARLKEGQRVFAYSYGNNFFEDRDQFEYYIYVTRTIEGKPIGPDELEWLRQIVAEVDRTAPKEPDKKRPEAAEEKERHEARELLARTSVLETEVRELSARLIRLNRALDELSLSMTEGFDRVMQGLASQIQGLAMDQIQEQAHKLMQAGQSELEQLLSESLRKEQALVLDIERLKKDRDRLRSRIVELELQLAEAEHDLSNTRAAPRAFWTKEELELLELLETVGLAHRFRRGLRELVPGTVSMADLVANIRSLVSRSPSTHHEHANTKAIERKGKATFYEVKCNLGPCGDAGRLYYTTTDGRFRLLGFGTKETQDQDIEAIFREQDQSN